MDTPGPTPADPGSPFGRWDVEHGVPVFREEVHPDAAVCRWNPVTAPVTDRHWCAVGNRRFQLVADNGGTAAVWDTAHGHRWLTAAEPGTGATVVTPADGGPAWATDRPRWPAGWVGPATPVRTWGPTWFTVAGAHDGIRVERTVACPEGDLPWLLVRVTVVADERQSLDVAEEWSFAPRGPAWDSVPGRRFTARPDPSGQGITLTTPGLTVRFEHAPDDPVGTDDRAGTGEGTPTEAQVDGGWHPRVRLVRQLHLEPGVPATSWFVIGLPDEGPRPVDPARCWDESLAALRRRLPAVSSARLPALTREVPWHVALLTGGAALDAVLGGHTLDQGSVYSFHWGFNGAARDPLQHALPLVYCEPDLALSVLRNTCSWGSPEGRLPYAVDGLKQPLTEWFQPSDLALWSLWLAAEYAAATGDLDAFRVPLGFHPVHRAGPVPLIEHLVRQFRHLVDVVGTGAHGHVRIGNADWNDAVLDTPGVEADVLRREGESVLNSAMAAWVLPRFAGLLRRLGAVAPPGRDWAQVADEADDRARRWRDLVAGEWTGEWYRRARGPGVTIGEDDLWLEVQPWAILCGAAEPERARGLLATIDRVLRSDSPLGARVRGPAPVTPPAGRRTGEGPAGGVWPSINMTLAWAAAALDPDLAWDELGRMTLAAHTAAYPSQWAGTLTGPDAYNAPESTRPGEASTLAHDVAGMQSFPVNNLHSHAQVVLTYLRLLGVEPTADGSLRVGGPGGTFTSPVLGIGADGHGWLQAKGAVRVIAPAGPVEGRDARLIW